MSCTISLLSGSIGGAALHPANAQLSGEKVSAGPQHPGTTRQPEHSLEHLLGEMFDRVMISIINSSIHRGKDELKASENIGYRIGQVSFL